MVLSQNGFTANDPSVIRSVQIPGTDVEVDLRQGSSGDLLVAAAARWHVEVEPLRAPDGVLDCWGFAERTIRGSTTVLSNHASGTAVDLRARAHPLGQVGTFTPSQVQAIHAIVAAAGGCLRWGGDYVGRKDEMHLEINDGRTEADCAAALAAFTTPPAEGFLMALTDDEQREVLTGIRALKPGLILPARSGNCRVHADDQYGHVMNGEAEAADGRVAAQQALAAVQALATALHAKGVI